MDVISILGLDSTPLGRAKRRPRGCGLDSVPLAVSEAKPRRVATEAGLALSREAEGRCDDDPEVQHEGANFA